MKRRLKRIFAILAAILLAGMYLSTLIFALLDAPWAGACLRASIFATSAIPVALYAFLLVTRLTKKDERDDKQA